MLFILEESKFQFIGTLTVQGHVFKRFGEAKYLGVILDENLTWNAHVNSLIGTLRSSCQFI